MQTTTNQTTPRNTILSVTFTGTPSEIVDSTRSFLNSMTGLGATEASQTVGKTNNKTSVPSTQTQKATPAPKPVTKKAAPVEVEEASEFEETTTEETEQADITDEEIRAAFAAYAKRYTSEKAKKVLASYGVAGSAKLTQEQRREVLEKIS